MQGSSSTRNIIFTRAAKVWVAKPIILTCNTHRFSKDMVLRISWWQNEFIIYILSN